MTPQEAADMLTEHIKAVQAGDPEAIKVDKEANEILRAQDEARRSRERQIARLTGIAVELDDAALGLLSTFAESLHASPGTTRDLTSKGLAAAQHDRDRGVVRAGYTSGFASTAGRACRAAFIGPLLPARVRGSGRSVVRSAGHRALVGDHRVDSTPRTTAHGEARKTADHASDVSFGCARDVRNEGVRHLRGVRVLGMLRHARCISHVVRKGHSTSSVECAIRLLFAALRALFRRALFGFRDVLAGAHLGCAESEPVPRDHASEMRGAIMAEIAAVCVKWVEAIDARTVPRG